MRQPITERARPAGIGGIQRIYRFDNGYGASVINNQFSYGGNSGLWELAVTKYTDGDNYIMVYDTPITNDVIGYLTDAEVDELLGQIESMKQEQTS